MPLVTKKASIARSSRTNPGLRRDDIVAAAGNILQRDGYEALTMRRLARELGVEAASLYWHVKNKEQLEDLLFCALLEEVTLAVEGVDWRADLRAIARQIKDQLLRRRDMQRISAGRFVVAPPLLRQMETILGVLRHSGLANRDVAFAIYALLNYINGFVLFQTAPLSAAQATGKERHAIFVELREQFSSLPPQSYPNSIRLADDLTADDPDGRFEFGLDLLIEGLERRIPPTA